MASNGQPFRPTRDKPIEEVIVEPRIVHRMKKVRDAGVLFDLKVACPPAGEIAGFWHQTTEWLIAADWIEQDCDDCELAACIRETMWAIQNSSAHEVAYLKHCTCMSEQHEVIPISMAKGKKVRWECSECHRTTNGYATVLERVIAWNMMNSDMGFKVIKIPPAHRYKT